MKVYYPLDDFLTIGLVDQHIWNFKVLYMGKNDYEIGKLLTRAEITGDKNISDHQLYELHSYRVDFELNQTEELWVHSSQYREALKIKL